MHCKNSGFSVFGVANMHKMNSIIRHVGCSVNDECVLYFRDRKLDTLTMLFPWP